MDLAVIVTMLAALFSWLPLIRYPGLPDGYVWSNRPLRCEYPPTPAGYPTKPILIRETGQRFENGTELFRTYFHQGWWICRRNFFEGTDGYPYDPADWSYLEGVVDLPDDRVAKFPQLAMRDGCKACSAQIAELLASHSTDELKRRMTRSIWNDIWLPVTVTFVAIGILVFWIRKRASQDGSIIPSEPSTSA